MKMLKMHELVSDSTLLAALHSVGVEDGSTVLTPSAFATEVLQTYPTRDYIAFSAETDSEAKTQFIAVFNAWADRTADKWVKLYDAALQEYDLLENYDRKEEGGWTDTTELGAAQKTTTDARSTTDTDTRTITDTDTRSTTDTDTRGTTTTRTPVIKTKTENYIYGDDSSTAAAQSYSVTGPENEEGELSDSETSTNSGTLTRQNAGTLTTTHGGTLVSQNAGTLTEAELARTNKDTRLFSNYRVHGNIGVSTGADMLSKEVALRKSMDIVLDCIADFIQRYTLYLD